MFDTEKVWGKSNLSNIMNKEWLDVYICIYFWFIGIRKHSSIKMIDKLTIKANSKGYKYHCPKKFK